MTEIVYEPFKIKMVEPLPVSTEADRRQWIEAAHHNIFALRSNQVVIDLLTDSGTSAMSDAQWAAMLTADESYAGSRSFSDLEKTVRELTGMEFTIPVHQGRAAEHLLFSTVLSGGEVIPSNALFDTTLANIQVCGASGLNLMTEEGLDPFLDHPFKGNIDLEKLERKLKEDGTKVPLVVLTITNNTGGGQPVSLDNIEATAKLCRSYDKMLVIDACRFAENAYFIKQRDPSSEIQSLSIEDIAKRCFGFADAITFSGKKDALVNIGGLLCVRDRALSEKLKNKMIVVEGFPTYGGLAGYSLAAMNQGLHEVLDERYLEYRVRTIEWMAEQLTTASVPILRPAGGHAIYIESSKFFPHIPRENLPGIALSTELYIRGGIRGCELGTVAFGYRDEGGTHVLPPLDLVRLAVPRRVYTEAHMGFVVECLIKIYEEREYVRGYEFVDEYPVLRHFRSKFRQVEA